MTQKTENTSDLAIPVALAVRLQAAAEEQHRPARDVLRDAVEGYLRAWRPVTPSTTQRSPTEAAAHMMRARQSNFRLDDAALRDLWSPPGFSMSRSSSESIEIPATLLNRLLETLCLAA